MKKILVTIFYFASLLVSFNACADNISEKIAEITIKGIDSDKQVELPGNSEWTFINRKTNRVITINGSNKGTKVKVVKDFNKLGNNTDSIYIGDWLISALSEPYAGLSTLKITDMSSQTIDINMVLKSLDIEVNMPDEAIAGTVEKISWKIPKAFSGKFTLQKKGEKPRFYAAPRLFTRSFKDSKYDLKIPAVVGEYILRYYSLKNTRKVIYEKPLKVVAADIILNTPKEAIAGTEIDLSWVAPKTSKAQINLKFAHNKADFNARYHVRTNEKKAAKLLLPSGPGDYVLRWFSIYDRQAMFEKPIKLLPQKVSIKAPNTANAGTMINISWDSPPRSEGRIVIFPVENDENKKNNNLKPSQLAYTKKKSKALIQLPPKAGKYILRYLNESDFFVAAEHHIQLLEP